MLNIPESVKTLFQMDGVFKNFRVHFPNGEHADLTNSDIVSESVKFTESICSKEVFQFGLSERSQIEFECVNMPNIYGVTIECGIEIDTSSLTASEIADIQSGTYDGALVLEADSDIGFGYYRIPYGVFVVQSCPRSHGAMYRRRVTAYSLYPIEEKNVFGGLFQSVTPFENVKLSMPALNAVLGKNELEKTALRTDVTTGVPVVGYFYNSNKHSIAVNIDNVSSYRRIYVGGDFSVVNYQTDYEKYEYFGRCVAEMLDNAGIDILYDKNGEKKFTDTESAMRAYMPEIFAPVVKYRTIIATQSETTNERDTSYSTPIYSGVLTPVFSYGGKGVVSDSTTFKYNKIFYSASYAWMLEGLTSLWKVTVSDYTTGDTIATITYSPTEKFPTAPNFTCTYIDGFRYRQNTDEPTALLISPTLTIPNAIRQDGGKTGTGYSYANAFSWKNAVDGLLELNAQFGRFARDGEFERIEIDRSNPIQISASEYSEVWWDDYSIDGVGLITYRFGNNDTVAYSIGAGGSEYDMTSNYLLEHYVTDDTETAIGQIQALLDSYFVPKLDDLRYLPADGEMIGLPYLEAGDYIEIASGSGETIGTYILSRTISGIQNLTDSIESKGGEVLNNGS